MIKTFILIPLLCLCFLLRLHAQTVPAQIKAFVKDLSDKQIAYKKIINQHLCVPMQKDTTTIREEILINLLEETRKKFLVDNRNAEPQIGNYKNLPKKEQLLLIDEKEIANVYTVKLNKRLLFFIYLKNNKVVSFSTMNKGNKRVFFSICN